jgi:hypothetical protein
MQCGFCGVSVDVEEAHSLKEGQHDNASASRRCRPPVRLAERPFASLSPCMFALSAFFQCKKSTSGCRLRR